MSGADEDRSGLSFHFVFWLARRVLLTYCARWVFRESYLSLKSIISHEVQSIVRTSIG